MNYLRKFKLSPLKPNNFRQIASILVLALSLPIFIWGIVTLNFNYKNRAATGEPGVCMARNKVITVTPVGGRGTCHDIQTAINAVNGDGYTILISRGDYNITNTINIANKHNLKIEGNVEGSVDEVWLSFNTTNRGGWGIKVYNSSGSIQRLHAEGITPNGLLSIQDSRNFAVNRTYLFGTSSHTLDIQNSNYIEVNNSEIRSSAGAVEIDQSHNVYLSRNKINNSSTGVRASNSTYVSIWGNLITANSGGAIRIWNVPNTGISNNTIINNIGSSATVDISGNNPVSSISQNIVAFNKGPGIVKEADSTNFPAISYNDVFNNYAGFDYAGMTNPTGTNGNISADPQLDNARYCPFSTSPVIYSRNPLRFMGAVRPCAGTPNPSASGSAMPTSSPSSSPTPSSTPSPTSTSSANPSNTPTASPVPKFGDVNGDGQVNIVDIGIIVDNYRIVPVPDPRADINNDGIANVVDIGIVIDNYEN